MKSVKNELLLRWSTMHKIPESCHCCLLQKPDCLHHLPVSEFLPFFSISVRFYQRL